MAVFSSLIVAFILYIIMRHLTTRRTAVLLLYVPCTVPTCSAFAPCPSSLRRRGHDQSRSSYSRDPPSLVVRLASASQDDDISLQMRCLVDRLVDRRTVALTTATVTLVATTRPCHAAESLSVFDLVSGQVADSRKLENGLLESRVLENVMNPPPYGMEGPDVYYPDWFQGSWNVNSLTTNVQAPCGVQLFGGNSTYNKARKEIGTVLKYASRFVPDTNGKIVADREFNVKSIAKVALGENSVVDVSLSTPNKFQCLLSPNGSPSLLTVDLIVLNRRQETVNATNFHCSEVVREIVSRVVGSTDANGPSVSRSSTSAPPPPLLKEIETTSLYTLVGETAEIHCRQRSATFLVPSQQDPMALAMWEKSRGRPIDVRFYDVIYTKR